MRPSLPKKSTPSGKKEVSAIRRIRLTVNRQAVELEVGNGCGQIPAAQTLAQVKELLG